MVIIFPDRAANSPSAVGAAATRRRSGSVNYVRSRAAAAQAPNLVLQWNPFIFYLR
jgi:hypothetical protein